MACPNTEPDKIALRENSQAQGACWFIVQHASPRVSFALPLTPCLRCHQPRLALRCSLLLLYLKSLLKIHARPAWLRLALLPRFSKSQRQRPCPTVRQTAAPRQLLVQLHSRPAAFHLVFEKGSFFLIFGQMDLRHSSHTDFLSSDIETLLER